MVLAARLRAEEILRCGTMVRRRGRSLWQLPLGAGSDVLARSRAVQREPRSRGARQSLRETSKQISVQRVDEQGDSVAALGKRKVSDVVQSQL